MRAGSGVTSPPQTGRSGHSDPTRGHARVHGVTRLVRVRRPIPSSDALEVETESERPSNHDDGHKAGLPLGGQRLVQPFNTHSDATGQLTEIAGARNRSESLRDEHRVVTQLRHRLQVGRSITGGGSARSDGMCTALIVVTALRQGRHATSTLKRPVHGHSCGADPKRIQNRRARALRDSSGSGTERAAH